jgi:hypothetical protein
MFTDLPAGSLTASWLSLLHQLEGMITPENIHGALNPTGCEQRTKWANVAKALLRERRPSTQHRQGANTPPALADYFVKPRLLMPSAVNIASALKPDFS